MSALTDALIEQVQGLERDLEERQRVAMAILLDLEESDLAKGRRWRDAYCWLTIDQSANGAGQEAGDD